MCPQNLDQPTRIIDQMKVFSRVPFVVVEAPNPHVSALLADLSPDIPWGDRQIAAIKLGNLRSSQALPGLLAALPGDPFWMVRCAIIQALEKINDPGAIPTLREVAKSDGFQVVRSYAAKAIERLTC